MIPFDFDYYRPDTLEEAVQLFFYLERRGKSPLYFGGGTEIITFARSQSIHTQAVIDLKAIPQCQEVGFSDNYLVLGACVSLTRIADFQSFSLLGKACKGIADHTAQGKISLGGNICGKIIYHEALLPLLVTNSLAVIAGEHGQRQIPIEKVFHRQLLLNKGECIVQFLVEKDYLSLPNAHVKKTRSAKIDYPLLSLAAIRKDEQIRFAVSGVCSFPFRSAIMEDYLNEEGIPYEYRVKNALDHLPAPLLDNASGKPDYRRFVLFTTLLHMLKNQYEVYHV